MMLIFIRTLEVSGWFADHGPKTPAESLNHAIVGQYELSHSGAVEQVVIITDESDQLLITRDSIPFLWVKLSDFEDEQVLVELYSLDSLGKKQRLEGCELLVLEESGKKSGSTLGEFCGLKQDTQVYIDLQVQFDETQIFLQVESRHFEDQMLVSRENFLLERQETHDE